MKKQKMENHILNKIKTLLLMLIFIILSLNILKNELVKEIRKFKQFIFFSSKLKKELQKLKLQIQKPEVFEIRPPTLSKGMLSK